MKLRKFVLFLFFILINLNKCKSDDFKLLILHNNDMHGRFEETSQRSGVCKSGDKCYGGFARVAHIVRKARRDAEEGNGPNVLYLNAGDTYTGTPWFSVHKWKIVTEFLNIIHPDVASLGNHEFDLGVAGVVPYIRAASFPIVAANLDFSEEPTLEATNITKSVVLEVDGKRIGVIGYLTGETALISASGKVKFEDEVKSIKEESERLDQDGVKIIIALGHSGYLIDQKIASEVPLVDVVVGGHTNTFLWNGPKPDLEEPEGPYPKVVKQSSGKKVPVVQAYAYTKYLGSLNLVFNDEGDLIDFNGQPILLNKTVTQESDVVNLLGHFRAEIDELGVEVIGKSRVRLNGDSNTCRLKECNFGNLISEAFVFNHMLSYGGAYWTDAPIGIVCGGAIRNVVEPKKSDGTITRGELLGAMPFDDSLVTLSLNGSDLLKTLEIGARANGKTSRGEFLQVSGIRYHVDFSKPVNSRVSKVLVRCGACSVPVYEPLDLSKSYRMVTTQFLSDGGDGHAVLRDLGYNKQQEDSIDVDAVVHYFKLRSPIYTEEDGRIIVENEFLTSSLVASGECVNLSLMLSAMLLFGLILVR